MHFHATIAGRAAHAGVEPEKGRNALLEAAHKTIARMSSTDAGTGVLVNVGAHQRRHPPQHRAARGRMLDRHACPDLASQEAATAAILAILTTSMCPIRAARWRSARTPAHGEGHCLGAADRTAVAVATDLGFGLRDTATGGGSDANTTSGARRSDARRPRADRGRCPYGRRSRRAGLDRPSDHVAGWPLPSSGAAASGSDSGGTRPAGWRRASALPGALAQERSRHTGRTP